MEMHHKNCFVGRGGLEPPKMSTNQLCDLPNFNSLRYMGFDKFPMHHMNISVNILWGYSSQAMNLKRVLGYQLHKEESILLMYLPSVFY